MFVHLAKLRLMKMGTCRLLRYSLAQIWEEMRDTKFYANVGDD